MLSWCDSHTGVFVEPKFHHHQQRHTYYVTVRGRHSTFPFFIVYIIFVTSKSFDELNQSDIGKFFVKNKARRLHSCRCALTIVTIYLAELRTLDGTWQVRGFLLEPSKLDECGICTVPSDRVLWNIESERSDKDWNIPVLKLLHKWGKGSNAFYSERDFSCIIKQNGHFETNCFYFRNKTNLQLMTVRFQFETKRLKRNYEIIKQKLFIAFELLATEFELLIGILHTLKF